MKKNPLGRVKEKLERAKASVRAQVEHPFHVLKNLFRHRKTRYRGLAKNTTQLFALFGFANLLPAGPLEARPHSVLNGEKPTLMRQNLPGSGGDAENIFSFASRLRRHRTISLRRLKKGDLFRGSLECCVHR